METYKIRNRYETTSSSNMWSKLRDDGSNSCQPLMKVCFIIGEVKWTIIEYGGDVKFWSIFHLHLGFWIKAVSTGFLYSISWLDALLLNVGSSIVTIFNDQSYFVIFIPSVSRLLGSKFWSFIVLFKINFKIKFIVVHSLKPKCFLVILHLISFKDIIQTAYLDEWEIQLTRPVINFKWILISLTIAIFLSLFALRISPH